MLLQQEQQLIRQHSDGQNAILCRNSRSSIPHFKSLS